MIHAIKQRVLTELIGLIPFMACGLVYVVAYLVGRKRNPYP